MSRRRKSFSCGHKGYGQYCHQCREKEKIQQRRQQQKTEWEETFANDCVDLKALPRNVILKARRIIKGLADGRNYREFDGKRLRHDRLIISIPVTPDYRLLCRDSDGGVVPETVSSHEDYNVRKPGS